MPKIPTLQPGAVTTQRLPGVQVTPTAPEGAFGGGGAAKAATGEALQLGSVARDLIQREKKRADDIVITKFYTDAMNAKNSIRSDPKTGYINKKGAEVANTDFVGEIQKDWESRVGFLEKDLKNQEQRAFAARIKGQIGNQLMNNAQSYWSTETRRYERETTENALAVTHDNYRENPNEHRALENYKEKTTAFLQKEANAAGHSKEWVQNQFDARLSKAHVGALEDLVAIPESRGRAKTYFEQYNQEMTPDDRNRMRNIIEQSNQLGESQDVVDEVLLQHPTSIRAGLQQIRDMNLTPEVRRMAESRYQQFVNLNRRENNRILSENFSNDLQVISNAVNNPVDMIGPGLPGARPRVILEDFIPPHRLDKYDAKMMNELKKAANGNFNPGNEALFEKERMLAITDPALYMSRDYNNTAWYDDLNNKQRRALSDGQLKLKAQDEKFIRAVKSDLDKEVLIEDAFFDVFPKLAEKKELSREESDMFLEFKNQVASTAINKQIIEKKRFLPEDYAEVAKDISVQFALQTKGNRTGFVGRALRSFPFLKLGRKPLPIDVIMETGKLFLTEDDIRLVTDIPDAFIPEVEQRLRESLLPDTSETRIAIMKLILAERRSF